MPTAVLATVLAATAACGTDDEGASSSPEPTRTTTSATHAGTPSQAPATKSERPSPQRSSPGDGQTQQRKRTPRPLYDVVDVVDGDTVKVDYRGTVESIRIIGIDTPETVSPSVPDECWGAQASAAAKRMLTGRRVALVFDPTQGRRDYYGRLLAYVERPGLGDFGLAQLHRGNAIEYTYDTAYQRQQRYLSAQRQARDADRGLWGACGGADVPLAQPTPTPKQQSPSNGTAGGQSCAAGYRPCIAPYPPDLDCADVDGPIRVTGEDPHGLDRDGDGLACE